MADKGLLFIPDISGFTKFVNETEIEHSRIIIEELLENIINSNKIGLQVSELEGDAVLFYRFGESPAFEDICHQVEQMFCNFHKKLKNYEVKRMCLCSACKNAVNLSLKVITHYGEFSSYTVKDFSKLIGKDVIIAHQLLKNDIDLHEYWLVTGNLMKSEIENGQLREWLRWQPGTKKTENGHICFEYCLLTPLKNRIIPDPPPDRTIGQNRVKVVSSSEVIGAGLVTVLATMGNLSIRHKWQDGVVRVENINHPIYHLGVRFSIVTDKGSTVYYSSSFTENDDTFCLSETDEQKTKSLFITLRAISENETSVTLDLYLPKNPLTLLLFSLLSKRKTQQSLNTSLANLQTLIHNNDVVEKW